MKLSEALALVHQPPGGSEPYRILLACGFSPLHLKTFLAAHLQKRLNRPVEMEAGLYGSLAETLDRLSSFSAESAAIFIEWPDLDARLGYRSLGGWRSPEGDAGNGMDRLIASARASLSRFAQALQNKPGWFPTVISLPSVALPPSFHTVGWQASPAELALEAAVSDFATTIASLPAVSVLNRQRLSLVSVPAERYDFRADLHAGFPYSLKHADLLAEAVSCLTVPEPPKKGLISDLDDTMWRGIVGEEGPQGVAWDLTSHAQIHGLYQRTLQSLAEQGVLIGIASKNNAATAEEALSRDDFLIKRDRIFPAEIHWDAKSASVARILKTWNVSAESVVFVDDSRMEIEEVRAAHPGMEAILFPKQDYAAAFSLLQRLRDLFGKPSQSSEDSMRLESIRSSQQLFPDVQDLDRAEQFLASSESTVTIHWQSALDDPRILELVNKTNQFNLNGKRFTGSEWHKRISTPGTLVAVVSYHDKFGPLGKISVLVGRQNGLELEIETWVMSCRAFSRRIEHQILRQLFEKTDVGTMRFAFVETPKNGTMREFLNSVCGMPPPVPQVTRAEFEGKCPPLYHHVAFIGKD